MLDRTAQSLCGSNRSHLKKKGRGTPNLENRFHVAVIGSTRQWRVTLCGRWVVWPQRALVCSFASENELVNIQQFEEEGREATGAARGESRRDSAPVYCHQ
jgi:hypothetical protein